MGLVRNSDTLLQLRRAAQTQQATEQTPQKLSDTIVPTIEINPALLRRCNIVRGSARTTSGNSDVYTTPTDREFYLVGFVAQLAKDATCDSATSQATVTVVIDGATQELYHPPTITLTAQQFSAEIFPQIPVKLDKGTPIRFSGSFTAGVMIRTMVVIGYTVENILG